MLWLMCTYKKSFSNRETLNGKFAFEKFAERLGVRITHYHADNSRFGQNAFIVDLKSYGQIIVYCVVNAHQKIRDLQEIMRICTPSSSGPMHGQQR